MSLAIIIILTGLALLVVIVLACAVSWYRIVDPSQAHLVVTPHGKKVISSDSKVSTTNTQTYFAIPSVIPWIGRSVRILDLTIKEIVITQETYEKDQARYSVRSSTKYRIVDVETAAETFVNDNKLREQLQEVVSASVRAITGKYDVQEARSKKQQMSIEILREMQDDLDKWGLKLISFQLVDFQDTEESSIISDISKRREIEIESITRENNAEKLKSARMKEAETEEHAKQREIEKDKVIGEQEQKKAKHIAEQKKLAEEKRLEVIKIQQVKEAEIAKQTAVIKAEEEKAVMIIKSKQQKESEEILLDKKRLEGEGDRIRAEEQAKGAAAKINENGIAEANVIELKGLAEAKAKDELQKVLDKFTPESIAALVAEKVVEKDKQIGIEGAKALSLADVKVFAGSGENSEKGFEIGKLVSAMTVSNEDSANATLNNMARPNDLGMTALALQAKSEEQKKDKA